MMFFDLALVAFLVGFFGPVLVLLIDSLRNERRIRRLEHSNEELKLFVWSLLPEGAREIMESDLPEEEVRTKWV